MHSCECSVCVHHEVERKVAIPNCDGKGNDISRLLGFEGRDFSPIILKTMLKCHKYKLDAKGVPDNKCAV